MNVFATRQNYDKLSDGYAKKQCDCHTSLACVMTRDPQKVWRCNHCYTPILHPRDGVEGPTEDLYPPPYKFKL
jgi:hypothetical protein